MPAVITLEHVHKRFREPVLRDVSLRIPAGIMYALVGPGGGGKSVLLKHIAGLLPVDEGEVVVNGVVLGRLDEAGLGAHRRKVGMLFQNNALFDFMTVGENVAFPLRRLESPEEQEVTERVQERLSRVALPGIAHRSPGSLSGGQKKRVGIARATITRAPLLLYDEPTAGLDPVTSQKIYNLIRDEQKSQECTAVVISSDVAGVLTIADRVGMLHRGSLLFDGTVEEARSTTDPAVRQFVHGLTEGPL